MTASRRVGRVWLLAVAALPCACTGLLGIEPPIEDAGATLDAGAGDVALDTLLDQTAVPETGPAPLDASGVALVIVPSQVSFAYDMSAQTVTVTNVGTAASPPLSATLLGGTSAFLVWQSSCSAPLAGGASCGVTLAVQPNPTVDATSLLRVGGDGVFAYASIQGPTGAGSSSSGSSSSSSSGGGTEGGASSSSGGSSSGGGGSSSGASSVQTLSGSAFDVWGVTSQGLVIASGEPGGALLGAPLDGGTGIEISTATPSAVRVVGDTVFAWQGSTLALWSGSGPAQVVSTSSQAPFAAVYGSSAFFLDSVSGSAANLVEVQLLESGYPESVVGAVTLPPPMTFNPCNPVAQITAGGMFIGACVGGTGQFWESIWYVDSTGTPTHIATGVSPVWGADAMGHFVFVTVAAGGGEVVDAMGNFVATLDTNVAQGMMLPSGNAAVYVASGSLRTNTVPPGTPTTLATGVAGLWGLSPSGAYALFYDASVILPPLGQATDLKLVATNGSSTAPVVFTATPGAAAPITFTADETYLAWVAADETPMMMFDVNVASTSTGMSVDLGPPIVTTPPSWPVAAQGTNLVYLSTTAGFLATFDTATAQAEILAAQVGPSFALTPTLDSVVYSVGTDGVFWEPLP